jgi:hypothetical protein
MRQSNDFRDSDCASRRWHEWARTYLLKCLGDLFLVKQGPPPPVLTCPVCGFQHHCAKCMRYHRCENTQSAGVVA